MTDTVLDAGPAMLASPRPGLDAHLATFGPLPAGRGEDVVAAAERAHLTGRGGAGFPAATKLRAVAGRRPVVVANGAEGEPASRKDRTLMARAPHLVLDGVQAAAIAVGAREAFVYANPASVAGLRAAMAERQRAGRVAGASPASIRIHSAAIGFVSGQESAVVCALSGGPALPRSGPRVMDRGVDGRPTLVQNVETLAQLALLARGGALPSRLLTVYDPAGRAQVLEVEPTAALGWVLERAGWRGVLPSAVLVGGYHGRWLPPSALHGSLTDVDLARFGARLGAGVVIPLAPGDCGLAMTASIVRYLASESAGQCGPCMFGLPHLAGLVERLAAGRFDPALVGQVRAAAGLVVGRGACRHPDGTVGMAASALQVLADDVAAHSAGRCLSGLSRAA